MSTQGGGDSAAEQAAALRRRAAAAKKARAAGTAPRKGQSATALGKDAKAWAAGAVGEERTAVQLARLGPSEAIVLHDRLLDPTRPWNLDHVVVALSGAFFVDAKNWRGHINVYRGSLWRHWTAGPKAGRQHASMDSELDKVREMTVIATRRLGWPMHGVIALAGSNSTDFEGPALVRGVTVVAVKDLPRWLRAGPQKIRAEDLPVLARAAERTFPPAVVTAPKTGWQTRMGG